MLEQSQHSNIGRFLGCILLAYLVNGLCLKQYPWRLADVIPYRNHGNVSPIVVPFEPICAWYRTRCWNRTLNLVHNDLSTQRHVRRVGTSMKGQKSFTARVLKYGVIRQWLSCPQPSGTLLPRRISSYKWSVLSHGEGKTTPAVLTGTESDWAIICIFIYFIGHDVSHLQHNCVRLFIYPSHQECVSFSKRRNCLVIVFTCKIINTYDHWIVVYLELCIVMAACKIYWPSKHSNNNICCYESW